MASATLDLLISLKDEATAGLDKLSGALGTVAGIAGGAALAGVVGLGAALVAGAGDAREAAKITAQTSAAITSTGNAAGVTASQVEGYAAALSAASGTSLFGDSQIQESTNLLLTFTNIKDKTLEAATAISVDMAQALGGAPKDAAIQLGKALNDPIAGISALSRVGVTFTEEQKGMIAALVEGGDVAGAQAVILAELNREFGGSAQAAATADGGIAQFQDRLGEAAETAGGAFLPLLDQLSVLLNTVVAPALESAAAAVGPFVAEFAAALPGILASLQPVVDMIGANLVPILVVLGGIMAGLVAASIGTAVVAFLTVAAPIAALVALGALLVAAWQSNFGGIQGIVTGVMASIQATVSTVLAVLLGFWQSNGAAITATATTIFGGIQTFIGGVLNIIAGLFNTVLAVIRGDWKGAFEGLQQAGEGFMTAIGVIFATLRTVLVGAFNLAIDGIKLAWSAFTSTAETLGRNIISGIVTGVSAAAGALTSAVQNAANSALDAAKSALGIKSPSQVFAAEVGMPITQGVAAGILAAIPEAVAAAMKLSEKVRDAALKDLDKLKSELQKIYSEALGGIGGLARDQAGAARDVRGLRDDGSDTKAAASTVNDTYGELAKLDAERAAQNKAYEEERARLQVTAAQNDDPEKRAAAAQQLIALDQAHAKEMTALDAERLQTERDLAVAKQAYVDAGNAAYAQNQIAEQAQRDMIALQQQANELRKQDPKLAQEFFDLRAAQILEIAKLEQEAAGAKTAEDIAFYQEQIALIKAAQAADAERFALSAADRQAQLQTVAGNATAAGLNAGGVGGGASITFAAGSIVINGGGPDIARQVQAAIDTALRNAGLGADARRRTA